MPHYLVRQPNGLYAEFSTIVDAFTIVDMTEANALEHYSELMGHEDAEAKVRRGVEDQPLQGGPPGTGHDRWDEAIDTMTLVNPVTLEEQERLYPWIWAGEKPPPG